MGLPTDGGFTGSPSAGGGVEGGAGTEAPDVGLPGVAALGDDLRGHPVRGPLHRLEPRVGDAWPKERGGAGGGQCVGHRHRRGHKPLRTKKGGIKKEVERNRSWRVFNTTQRSMLMGKKILQWKDILHWREKKTGIGVHRMRRGTGENKVRAARTKTPPPCASASFVPEESSEIVVIAKEKK